jgi:hypothetical protein
MAKKKAKRKPHSEVRWAVKYQRRNGEVRIDAATLDNRSEARGMARSYVGLGAPWARVVRVRITEITNTRGRG